MKTNKNQYKVRGEKEKEEVKNARKEKHKHSKEIASDFLYSRYKYHDKFASYSMVATKLFHNLSCLIKITNHKFIFSVSQKKSLGGFQLATKTVILSFL